MPISDTPMTYLEFRAIRAQVLRELKLKPTDWIQLLAPTVDSTGTPQNLLDTSGQITEANSSTMTTRLSTLRYANLVPQPTFAAANVIVASDAVADKAHPIRLITTLTATAGGEITSAAVAPAIASYDTCMCITHIFSDQTTAAITGTFATTSGLASGIASLDITTSANAVAPDWSPGLFWKGSANNEAINYSCAAGQAGNAQNITFIGYYWAEP